MWRLIPIFIAVALGFWFGRPQQVAHLPPALAKDAAKVYPVAERKSFVVILYAYNQELWCERALSSIFEQDYDHYRVIMIDDGSRDATSQKANQFIVDNNQTGKVILVRNESKLGKIASLYRAIDSCLDREIVLTLEAKDWLVSPEVLPRLNATYQNPNIWLTLGGALDYPSYETGGVLQPSFYAAIFKQIQLQDLFQDNHFATHDDAYLVPLQDLSSHHIAKLPMPQLFANKAASMRPAIPAAPVHYEPLAQFPPSKQKEAADILVFSFNRPLQLYACLESIQRYMMGFDQLTVLYRVSDEQFQAGYEKVKSAFPQVRFVMQELEDPKRDFKTKTENIVFQSPSKYILFAVDDIIVKDFVDLKFCMEQMERTSAYGFYLRFGRHIQQCYQTNAPQAVPESEDLAGGLYAWNIKNGQADWGFPNSLDMTLFRKESIKEPFTKMKYKTPNSLEFGWAKDFAPQKAIGLYFERSKLVNVPMNLVGRTGNPHMNYLSVEELLAKFNLGLKIDIEPLYKIENRSPHMDYIPEFIAR